MDNFTALYLLPIEEVTETTTDLYPGNMTVPFSPNDTTETNPTTAGGAVPVVLSLTGLGVYLAVRILWGGLSLFGNSLTILAVTRFERLQTCTNYFICSLAVSDLVSAVAVPLIVVYALYPDTWFFIPICLCQKTLSLISTGGNLVNILYISIDRYIYIAYPLRYHLLVTPRRTWAVLTVTWTWLLVFTPTIMYTENHLLLGMPCQYHIFLSEWVVTLYFPPQFFLTILLTTGFHFAIARIAYKQGRRIHAQQQPYDTLAVAINQSTKKISHTLAIVLGVYLLAYMPRTILGIFEQAATPTLVRFSTLFYWANTWVNPLIYAWRLRDFRIAFRKIFTGTGSFNEVPGIDT